MIFFTTEFEKDSMINANIIQKKLDTSVHVIIIQDPDDFVTEWNNMQQYGSKKDDNIDLVVIDFHSYPSSMAMGRDANDPQISLDGMESKNINSIVLLGCNAGFASTKINNLAETFLYGNNVKQVVACDGTVYPWHTLLNDLINPKKGYESKNDYIFKYLLANDEQQARDNLDFIKYTRDAIQVLGKSFDSIGDIIDEVNSKK